MELLVLALGKANEVPAINYVRWEVKATLYVFPSNLRRLD
jgi:hypothetical protein